MTVTAGIILTYCIATVVAIGTRRVRIPYTAALLLTGVALGATRFAGFPHLTRELLFDVFLPGLLFEAAYHLQIHELRESSWTIGALAVPGVVASIALTAALLMGVAALLVDQPLAWTTALVFGGVIAATDPVAVTALFREIGAPRRLHVIVESESLFNDGTSIVLLTLLLAYLGGEAPTATALLTGFVRMTIGGAVIGAAIAWLVSQLRARLDDAVIEITLTTIVAYGAFVLAEELGCSGVIATVTAGIVTGHYSRRRSVTAVTRASVLAFWEWLAFALNSGVFFLLGTELPTTALARQWPLVLGGIVAVLCARAIVVGVTTGALSPTRERIPRAWSAVLVWGGLRGALSLVLALSIPAGFGNRDAIVALTAGAVLTSLVLQGMTMAPLLRRLGIGTSPSR